MNGLIILPQSHEATMLILWILSRMCICDISGVPTIQLMHVVILDLLRFFIFWTFISSRDCKRSFESQVLIDNATIIHETLCH